MAESYPYWITERMIRGVRGFNLDSYLMALEGWRRGLTLTWYYDPEEVTDLKIIGFNPLGKTFSLTANDYDQTHYFYRSRGDKVANEAVEIVHQKDDAKQYFNKISVPTPNGIMIHKETEKEDIVKQINSLQYPLVVKPVYGSLGKGVTTDIQNETELFKAIDYIVMNYEDYHQIIIEEYVEGDEFRVYVVDNEVVAATKRIAANVLGDGVHTIKQLVEQKNKDRKNNPYLARKQIEIDETVIAFLETQNMTINSIPDENKTVRLKGQANISAGGDPVDATDSLDLTSKQIAIEAIKAIPNLHHAGVDLIVNDEKTGVLGVNATADISMHVFPIEGEARNVPADILNYYYPYTIDKAKDKIKLYFDYKDTQQILRKKLAQALTITDAPTGKFQTARYIVSGKVQNVGYRNWIRRQALHKGLHGYTRNLKNKNVVVVVGGDEKQVESFEQICAKGPVKANVNKVSKLKWESSIKSGFEIRKTK